MQNGKHGHKRLFDTSPARAHQRFLLLLVVIWDIIFNVTINKPNSSKKRRSQEEKIGRRKWIIRTLKRQEVVLRRIDRRTRFLAAGLREWLNACMHASRRERGTAWKWQI